MRSRPRVMAVALVMFASLAACQSADPAPTSPPPGTSSATPSVGPSATSSVAPSVVPSATPPASPTASGPGTARAPLAEVLDFLTVDTKNVLFTDWDALKAAYGMADLTSADPFDERRAFLLSTQAPGATDAPSACFACRGYPGDALKTHWDFDNLDLAWEAEIWQRDGLVVVLRFLDDADLAPLIARFDEREYSTEVRDGVTIRVHDVALDQDWVVYTGRAMLNAAFLADGRTLLLGTTQAALDSALSQDAPLPALRSAPVLRDAVAALERPTSAYLAFELNELCNPLLRAPPNEELRATVEALLDQAGTLHPYTLMAVGNRGSLTPPSRIVFGYGDQAEAAADLAGRRLLAEEGVSVFANGRPLRELLTVVDAQATGGMIILSMGPGVPPTPLPSGGPGTAYILSRFLFDAIFAACDIGA